MKTAILILAAGNSSRMESIKQLLPIGKKTLLGVAIENAKNSIADDVICILGAHYEKVEASIKHYNTEIIYNPNFKNGLSSSIVEGIKHIKSRAYSCVLIMLADQPKIKAPFLNELIHSFKLNPTKISASSYNKSIGVPAIFPKSNFKQLLQLKGDKGAKDYLNSNKVEVITLKNSQLLDIDTPQDYLDFINSE